MKIRDRIKELRRVPASELIPNPKNWRTHPEAQANALRGILSEVGIAGAVLARETPEGLMLIDGHLRAETLGTGDVPVLVLDVNEAEADKLLATFDPLSAMAEADPVKLDTLLRDVDTGSEELQKMLAELADEAGLYQEESKEIVEDEVPEPPVDPITKPGDLWILGRHRLLCGDSTKAEDVERLMAGEKADLCFTSPPYNVGRTPNGNEQKYLNDADARTKSDYVSFLCSFTNEALSVSSFVFVNVQSVSGNKIALIEYLAEMIGNYADTIIWDKMTAEPAMAENVLNSRFEFVHVFSQRANRVIGSVPFRGTLENIVAINSRQGKEFSAVHKATFPTQLAAHFVSAFCREGERLYEPFCGTGTTLIAAEQLNRTCYGMEISPQYCDVIVKRWETLTGKKAVLCENSLVA